MKPAILHTTSGDDWRCFFALIIRETESFLFNKNRKMATLVYWDDGAMRVAHDIEHLNSRTSAYSWVHLNEYWTMEKDVREDHEKRGLGRRKLEDLALILSQCQIPPKQT